MKINIQDGVISFGEENSIQLDVEPIFWANGCTTYHIYAYGTDVRTYNDLVRDEDEIRECKHVVITDNVSGETL